MKKIVMTLIAAGLLASCSSGTDPKTQGILDVARPPNQFHVARIISINGRNVVGAQNRFTQWVDAGTHTVVVTAVMSEGMSVGTVNTRNNRGQGEFTIDVEAGKRYRIAISPTDRTGGWEPVVWAVEDI